MLLRSLSSSCRLLSFYASAAPWNRGDNEGRPEVMRREMSQLRFGAYFKERQGQRGDKVSSIVKAIEEGQTSKAEALLSSQLQFHNAVLSRISVSDLLDLLVAVNMQEDQKLLRFRKEIMEYLLRRDLDATQLDRHQLLCFMDGYEYISRSYSAKKKQQKSNTLYLQVLSQHLPLLHPHYYTQLCSSLLADPTQKTRLMQLAHQFLKQISRNAEELSRREASPEVARALKDYRLISSILQTAKLFNCPEESFGSIHQLARKVVDEHFKKDRAGTSFLLKLYRAYPLVEEDSSGRSLKGQLRDALVAHLERTGFDKEKSPMWGHFCSTILHHSFYEHWMGLTFAQLGQDIILQPEHLNGPPTLPPLFWRIYHQHPPCVNNTEILKSTLRDCYPSEFVESPLPAGRETYVPIFQSQMRIRMEMVLRRLGLSFEKQTKLSSRYIDFLLQGKIILEVDGVHHYYPALFQNEQETTFRNLHLLLAGYRLIVVSIHEYNLHRDLQQLSSLLERKLDVMRQTGCLAVL